MIELFAFDVLQILINKIKRAEFFSVIMEKAADMNVLEQGNFFLDFIKPLTQQGMSFLSCLNL